jgi:hypothetical protein
VPATLEILDPHEAHSPRVPRIREGRDDCKQSGEAAIESPKSQGKRDRFIGFPNPRVEIRQLRLRLRVSECR